MTLPTRALLAATACAILAPAPKAHAQFNTILDLPGDGNIGNTQTIGTPLDPTQVNVGGGGLIGHHATLAGGSEINLNGGIVEESFTAESGSTVNINDGDLGIAIATSTFEAGSTMTMSGGTLGRTDFYGAATFTGGTAYGNVDFFSGSVVNISGTAEFTDAAGLDAFAGSTLTIDGGTFTTASDFAGDLTIHGGTFGNEFSHSAYITGNTTINGGSLGRIDILDGVTTINGGTFGNFFDAIGGSLTINGGTFGSSGVISTDTLITAGTFGSFTNLGAAGATVDVTGGDFFGYSDVDGGIVNISGGSFESQLVGGRTFELYPDATLNLTGTSFTLDGDALTAGTHIITVRGLTTDEDPILLDGLLMDGSVFKVALNSNKLNNFDYFSEDATLTVTVVPEPSSLALLGLGGLALIRRRR